MPGKHFLSMGALIYGTDLRKQGPTKSLTTSQTIELTTYENTRHFISIPE